MKWDDFKSQKSDVFQPAWVLTPIECPNCGSNIYQKVNEVLASNPPKHIFKCHECGWTGTA